MSLGVLIVILATFWVANNIHTTRYNKLQGEQQAERDQWEKDKQQLLQQVTASEAMAEAKGSVAVTKRADRAQTVKELDAIEQRHKERKAAVEATGGQLSDDELVDELCRKLVERGYPPCPK